MERRTEYRDGVLYLIAEDGMAYPMAEVMKYNNPSMDFDPATGEALGPAAPPAGLTEAEMRAQAATPRPERTMGEMAMGLLGDVPTMLNGTGIPERLALVNEYLNPVVAVGDSMNASREMFAPDRTAMQRIASTGDMLSGLAGTFGPMAASRLAGRSAAEALQEGLLGYSKNARNLQERY